MNKLEQQAQFICNLMDSKKRIFRVSEEILNGYKTKFCYLEPDLQLSRVLSGYVGTDSDAYILYAVSMLGIADSSCIAQVLQKLKAMNPNLPILDAKNKDQLRHRLRVLTDCGFLIVNKYSLVKDESYGNTETVVTFYSLCDSAISFINQRFSKRIRVNRWFQAKRKQEQIAMGSCAYVAALLIKSSDFREVCASDFRNRFTKTTMFMPIEMRMKREEQEFYLGILPAFIMQTVFMGDEELSEVIKSRLLLIRGYFEHRNSKGDPCYVMVCVESRDDFQHMASSMVHNDLLDNFLTNILFTGEGALREYALQESTDSLNNYFVCIQKDVTKEDGYSVCSLESKEQETSFYKI